MTLRDGTQVLWVHDARTPLVYFNVYLGVGSWSPWVLQHHGESAFYAQLDDQQGTLDRDGERLQLSLDAHVERWTSRIGLRFPKGGSGAALSLLRRALANVDFDRGAPRRAGRARRPTFASQLKEPSFPESGHEPLVLCGRRCAAAGGRGAAALHDRCRGAGAGARSAAAGTVAPDHRDWRPAGR